MGGAVSAVLDLPGKVVGAAGGLLGGEGEAPKKPEDAAAALAAKSDEGPKNQSIENRVPDLADREQTLGQRASAAGAQRTENEADTLGFTRPKRKSAARAILG